MKLTTRARYALRMMITLARQSNGNPLGMGYVAKTTQISRRYLDQVANALKSADLIMGTRGKGGGYQLSRPANAIRVGEVIEAAIGPINIVDCVQHPETCLKTDICDCRPLYVFLNRRIIHTLNQMTLADLVDHTWLDKATAEMDMLENDGDGVGEGRE